MRISNRTDTRPTLPSAAAWLGTAAVAIAAAFLVVTHSPGRSVALAQGTGLDGDDINVLAAQNRAFERIAETVTPAIVNIQTTQVI